MFGQDDKTDEQADTGATIQPATDAVADDSLASTSSDNENSLGSDTATDANVDTSDTPSDSTMPAVDEALTSTNDNTDLTSTADEPSIVSATNTEDDNGLLDIKKEALSELAPLIDHLDQTPEEHFKTTMMLIQATDDSSYVKTAYESAKKIPDDDVRAQALLDIVNEINYFTQAHNDSTDES